MSDKEVDPVSGLTANEQIIMERLIDVYTAFQQSKEAFSLAETKRIIDAIHEIQDVLGYRVLCRTYPDFWSKP